MMTSIWRLGRLRCRLSRRLTGPCPRFTSTLPHSRPRASPLLTLLLGAGVGATAYGLYDLYSSRTHWPPQIRPDLRSGLKAKHKGDLPLAAHFLSTAYNTSTTLPLVVFAPDPYLKTSGIGITLAEVLEADGKLDKAYDVYLHALNRMQIQEQEKYELSGPERLRAIALAYKLGELAGTLNRPEDEEKHLVWAVETIIPHVVPPELLNPQGGQAELTTEDAATPSRETEAIVSELALPEWATTTDFAAPLEALGTFYAQNGRLDYAMPLYLQAISILIPPAPQSSSTEDRCRAAQLMSNLSELLIRSQHQSRRSQNIESKQQNGQQQQTSLPGDITGTSNPATTNNATPSIDHTPTLAQAEAWATKALEISMRAREERAESKQDPGPTCEVAFAVALFNVAALRRMAGDKEKAKEYFALSLKQSSAIGMREGVVHAEDALHQLDGLGS